VSRAVGDRDRDRAVDLIHGDLDDATGAADQAGSPAGHQIPHALIYIVLTSLGIRPGGS
jgi:hypothetical protein